MMMQGYMIVQGYDDARMTKACWVPNTEDLLQKCVR